MRIKKFRNKNISAILILFLLVNIFSLYGCGGGKKNNPIQTNNPIPLSEGTPVTKEIPASTGGTVENGNAKVMIGGGVLQEDTKISLSLLSGSEISGGVSLKPDGLKFSKPVVVFIPLTTPQTPGSFVQVATKNQSTGNWEIAKLSDGSNVFGLVSDDGKSLLATVDHFSYFSLLSDSSSQINKEIENNTEKVTVNYGDGEIYVPLDYYLYEDGIQTLFPDCNNYNGISNGYSLYFLPGLDKGLSDNGVRYDKYKDVLEALFYQREMIEDAKENAWVKQYVKLLKAITRQDLVYGVFSSNEAEGMGLTVEATDDLLGAKEIFDLKLISSEGIQTTLNNWKVYSNFKAIDKGLEGFGIIISGANFIFQLGEDAVFMWDSTYDILLALATDYALITMRKDVFREKILPKVNDQSLKDAFSEISRKIDTEENNMLVRAGDVIAKRAGEGVVLAVETVISTASLLFSLGVITSIFGLPALPVIMAATAILLLAEVYYNDRVVVYADLLRTTAAGTLLGKYFYDVTFSENEVSKLTGDAKNTAALLGSMKAYLSYYFYNKYYGIFTKGGGYIQMFSGLQIWLLSTLSEEYKEKYEIRANYLKENKDIYLGISRDLLGLLSLPDTGYVTVIIGKQK